MPCTPGMRLCRSDCSHRRFVLDYVRARDEQAVRAEAATGGYATELGDYYGRTGRAVEPLLTFKLWLQQHTGTDYPYPRAPAAPAYLEPHRDTDNRWHIPL